MSPAWHFSRGKYIYYWYSLAPNSICKLSMRQTTSKCWWRWQVRRSNVPFLTSNSQVIVYLTSQTLGAQTKASDSNSQIHYTVLRWNNLTEESVDQSFICSNEIAQELLGFVPVATCQRDLGRCFKTPLPSISILYFNPLHIDGQSFTQTQSITLLCWWHAISKPTEGVQIYRTLFNAQVSGQRAP